MAQLREVIPPMDTVMDIDGKHSSNVHSIGYDEMSEILYVRFWKDSSSGRSQVPGPIYKYFRVPKNVYRQMYMSNSKGKFVWERIRNRYRYKMIGRPGWRKRAPSRKSKR